MNSPTTKPKGQTFTMMSMGDRLRYLMEVREITQVALARKIGLTQAAISNLVTDSSRKPSAPTLMKIAAALECNPTWILDGVGDPFSWAPVTSESQVELANLYKSMDDSTKAHLLATARLLARK